ncbi:MAG: cupredoxin domain-containing protein [Candidatus Eremiobacteraeota bacterium]|nr:cupredoxin domain-containing protein [Candidatus Eremiobacteraeota bacterium]MBC5828148.1 cupredoxin domain-containing protein [Candidatus Eremiobacteraeota bacterium]
MRHHLSRAFVLAASAVFLAFSAASCASNSKSGQITINITGDNGARSYSPSSVTVASGTIVTWINQDSQPHTATAPGAFDSGPIPPNGGRWTWIASVPGQWKYYSLIQPDMTGIITVNPPTTTNF